MTADEVLKQMQIAEAMQTDNPVCVIDPETRTITVPPEYQLLGVENDKRVERLYFQCPKIVGDNQDLSQNYQLFINYQNANGDPDAYHVEDMEVDGDNITFSWLLEENVTKYKGSIQIAFAAIIPGDEAEDPDKNRWNTTINTDCTCLVGLKSTKMVAESNPDALAQIWAAIDELKAGGGGGSYTLPIMSDTQLGGGKAVPKTEENVPVAVDSETGQLFVPEYPEIKSGITVKQMQDTDTAVTLPEATPYDLYIFPEMDTLAVTIADTDQEVHFFFDSGATATVFSLQSQAGGQIYTDAYSIDANMRYEVSVLHNVAIIKGVSTNAET